MRVKECKIFDGPEAFTAFTIEGEYPKTKWTHVRVGNNYYIPEVPIGAKSNMLLIKGRHDLTGIDIEFE